MCTLLTQNICLMCHTQELELGGNQIGDAGLTALAKAVESGALPQLEMLWLAGNSIGDVSLSALADVVSRGALPKCTIIDVSLNPASAEANKALNPFPTPGISAREQSARPSLRPGTAPRPLGLRGRPPAHLDRTRPRYNRNRVTEV